MTDNTAPFDYSPYRDVLKPEFADYLKHEPDASRVWSFSPAVVAGWLQTDDYMLALNRGTGDPETPDEVRARRVKVRQARRRLLETATEVRIVMAEMVFWRQVAPDCPSDAIMREQLDRIRQADTAPNVTVQVLPMGRSLLRGASATFTVLGFPDRGGLAGGLVYREGFDSEALSFDPERVELYEDHFQRLSAASVDIETYLAMAAERTPPSWLRGA